MRGNKVEYRTSVARGCEPYMRGEVTKPATQPESYVHEPRRSEYGLQAEARLRLYDAYNAPCDSLVAPVDVSGRAFVSGAAIGSQ